MELMLQPLRRYADFRGRASRTEYWMFLVFFLGAEFAAIVLGGVIEAIAGGGSDSFIMVGAWALAVLLLIIPSIALAFRRLHDSDKTAWWLLVAFLPGIGGLILLIFYCLDGTPGPNRFGPDPKGRGLTDVSVFT